MEKTEERVQLFYKNDFFKERPGLAEAIVDLEKKISLKIPTNFKAEFYEEYIYGRKKVLFGKIHRYPLFSMELNGIRYYQLFESKSKLKLYFVDMKKTEKNPKGLGDEDFTFWINEIENLPF